MGFLEWLTGRDKNASEIAGKDDSKVQDVVDELNNIASESGEVGTAKDNVKVAIDALTRVHGVSELTNSSIHPESYTSVFDDIGTSIKKISSNLESAAETIGEYNKNKKEHPFKTAFGTFGMAGLKVLEGGVSLIEDLGDGVTSIIGWVAPEGSAVENWAKAVTKANWSNDIFKGAYNTLDKYSVFTQDSGAASAFKVVGQTVSTIALGGALAGAADGLNAAGKFTKVASVFQKIGSSTTLSNSLVAGVSGLGSGTESALQHGASMNEAFGSGAIQGAIQGGLAFAGGKVSEKIQKGAAIKEMKNGIEDLNNKGLSTQAENMSNQLEALKKTSSGSMFQGYNDALTRRAYNSGFEIGKNGIKDFGGAARDFITKSGTEQASQFATTQITKANESLSKTINKLGTPSTQGYASRSVENVINRSSGVHVDKPKSPTGQFISKETAGKIGKITTTASRTGGLASNLGIVTADIVKEDNVADGAAAQFRRSSGVDNIKSPDKIETKKKLEIDSENSNGDKSNGDGSRNTKSNGDGSRNTKSNGNGFNSDGSKGGGSNGGGSSYSDGSISKQQFRKSDDDSQTDDKSKKSTTNDTTKTSDKKTTPDTTKTSDTKTTSDTTKTSDKKTTPDATKTSDTTSKSNNTAAVNIPQDKTTVHTGGGYSASNGYTGTGDYTGANTGTGDYTGANSETGVTDDISGITSVLDDGTTSIEDVIKGSKYTKIPTSSKPITTTSSSGSSAVIPIAAGLSAAAAAGIGAKAYMDRKKNNDNGEDDEEFDTDEWTGDDAVDIQYDDSSDTNAGENVLDADDDYSYQPAEETEKYDARSSDELADLQ